MTIAAGFDIGQYFPCLYYREAPAAIEWLCRVFGFVQRMCAPGDNGTVAHAELSFGDGVIMVASCKPESGWVSPLDLPAVNQAIAVYVPDPDAHYARAKSEGAEIVRDIRDEEYGARGYLAKGIEGNDWYIGELSTWQLLVRLKRLQIARDRCGG